MMSSEPFRLKKIFQQTGDSKEEEQPTQKKQPCFSQQNYNQNKIKYRRQSEHQCERLLEYLEERHQKELETSQYSNAEKIRNNFAQICQQRKKQRMRAVSLEHFVEKKMIKKFHQQEMQRFRLSWVEQFNFLRQKEERKTQKLCSLKKQDIQIYQRRILRKCRSYRPIGKIAHFQSLDTIERLVRKRGKMDELKKIRNLKKEINFQCQLEKDRATNQIMKREEERFEEKQTKRYNSLVYQISEARSDIERRFYRQEHRLKQKYKNVLKKLEHEQKIQIQTLSTSFGI